MASIFKPTGRTKYRIEYKDANGVRKIVPGFKDKTATLALARQLERDAQREQAGLPVVAQAQRQAPIATIIQAFINELSRLNRSAWHIYTTRTTLTRLFKLMAWPNLAAIRLEPFSTFLRGLKIGRAHV